MKSLVVGGILAELSLVPRIHMVVVRADSSKLSSDLCAIKQQLRIRKKERDIYSELCLWFYSCTSHTLKKFA